jgi:hypothetical protein
MFTKRYENVHKSRDTTLFSKDNWSTNIHNGLRVVFYRWSHPFERFISTGMIVHVFYFNLKLIRNARALKVEINRRAVSYFLVWISFFIFFILNYILNK